MAGGGRRPGRGSPVRYSVALKETRVRSIPLSISDTFTRTDSSTALGFTSDVRATWVPLRGVWGISSNQAYRSGVSGDVDLAVLDTGQADGTMQVTIAAAGAGGFGGLTWRAVDVNNYFLWQASGSIFDVSFGSSNQLNAAGDSARAFTTGDIIAVQMSGTTIKFIKNGSVVSTQTISVRATATKHGLMDASGNPSDGTRWDNFSFVPSTVAFIQEGLANQGSGSQNTTFSVSVPRGITAGDALVLSFAYSGSVSSVTGCGATWTRLVTNTDSSALVDTWIGLGGTAGQTTATVNFSSTTIAVLNLSEWSGVLSGRNASGTANASATSALTPTIIPNNNEAIYAVVANQQSGGRSVSSYTDTPSPWVALSSGSTTWVTYTLAPAYLPTATLVGALTSASRQANFNGTTTSITQSVILSNALSINDNFNRADSTTSLGTASDGGTWTIVGSGQLGISSNRAYVPTKTSNVGSLAGNYIGAVRDTGTAIQDVTVTVNRPIFSGGIGGIVIFGHTPVASGGNAPGTGYILLYVEDGTISVRRYSNASATPIATLSGAAFSSATFRITRDAANLITVYKNGTPLGSVTDSTFPSGTWCGFGSETDWSFTHETWDNFTALSVALSTPPPSSPPWRPTVRRQAVFTTASVR